MREKGFTYVEVLVSVVIFLFVSEIFCGLMFFSNRIFNENILDGEYASQIFFAESCIQRDIFQARSIDVISDSKILICDSKGNTICYYLEQDPYAQENMYKVLSKTLYRKENNENAQPITQYFKEILFKKEILQECTRIEVKLITEKTQRILERYYEKDYLQ